MSGSRTTPEARWLVVIHHLKPKPDYLRVRIGRRLRALGAVAIKNSVYVLPASVETRTSLGEVVREIRRAGGTAVVCEARFVDGLSDETAADLFRKARDREYSAIAEEARRLTSRLKSSDGAARRRLPAQVAQLKRRFLDAAARDGFGGRSRESTAALISHLEDRVQGVEVAGPLKPVRHPPQGATWVTRAGVMVDRIACAWLIRRFIDRQARFRFVSSRGYRPKRGEIRFDMSGAEFTHHEDRCTFEVLLARFQLRDPALKPIAEIVHDIDLEDGKYARPETAGVSRLITGLAIARTVDDDRIQQGAVLFNTLYESFRSKGERR
jgi:hypothetical protein